MGLLDRGKEVMVKRMKSNVTPSETPIAQAIAQSVVAVENQQAKAVEDLREAADLDVEHGHDPERRREALLELADAVSNDEFRSWYFAEILGEAGLDNPQKAEKYAGLEAEEWEERKRDWYREYHDRDVVDEPLEDADLEDVIGVADRHVQATFGLLLGHFERLVVEYDQAEAAERVLAGPIMKHNQIIADAAEEVERLQERVDQLEEQLDEDK